MCVPRDPHAQQLVLAGRGQQPPAHAELAAPHGAAAAAHFLRKPTNPRQPQYLQASPIHSVTMLEIASVI